VGEKVFVRARIRNSGAEGADKVRVRFFLGDAQVGQEQVIALPPGGTITVSTSFAAATPGQQQFRVQVEPAT
jgi:subtilase family serine protease